MLVPNRHAANENYRYGFNGKEKDDEIKGEGIQYDYGFRIYDARIGRFLSMDPLFAGYPYYTPYQFAGNRPIWAIDLDGLEELTKTATRLYSINYILDSSNNIIKGTYSFYSNYDKREMTVTSGEKVLLREGEEGGAVMIQKAYYRLTDMGRKDGLRRYNLIHSSYEGTGEFVATDPNNNEKAVNTNEDIKIEPVIKPINHVDIKKSLPNIPKPKPRLEANNKEKKDIEVASVGNLDVLKYIQFVKNKAEFKTNPNAALNEIADRLKQNPKNEVIIYSVSPLVKGTEVEFNLFSHNTTIDEVMKNRESLIRSELNKRGVKSQFTIKSTYGINGMQNMTGTIIEYKKNEK